MANYVASSTLRDPEWANSSVVTGDVAREVAALKRGFDGDLLVCASFRLARALIEHGLVDELRLCLYPCVLGTGERLPAKEDDTIALRLVDAQAVGDDLMLLTYRVERNRSRFGHSFSVTTPIGLVT